MSRSAILAAAIALFCVSFPSSAKAQREVPRSSILKRGPQPRNPAKSAADSAEQTKLAATLAPGTGSVMGAVVDSLHEDMLADAAVSIVGLPARHATTSAGGVFRIDSIPPGKYVLQLSHAVLDTLGIQVVSDTIDVTAGHMATIEMAIPSQTTVAAIVCTPAKLRFGPGVILGRVFDAETQGPATGAEVSVAWKETVINMTVGVQTGPRVRKATVAADGTYRICGVPKNLTGTLQAIRGEAQTAEVPLEVTDQTVSTRVLFLPPPAVAAGDSGAAVGSQNVRRAVITGKVTNAGGVAVDGARVSVQGSTSSTATGADGRFTLTGVLPGTQSVLVRRVGYSPVETPLDVTLGQPNEMTVRLGTYAPTLSRVDVKAKADPLEATGFERRRKMGFGRYMDMDAIAASHPTYTSDILRRVPGIQILGSGSSATISTTRSNGCVKVMIDDNAVSVDGGQTIDQIVGAQDVVAVEFYNSVDVPMELSSGNLNGCALLVLWTKGKLQNPKK
ncbi:MAG TPA: carboxypeptidase regulatory-like domain-containing protein [Gemmatimonadaceae bacterium]